MFKWLHKRRLLQRLKSAHLGPLCAKMLEQIEAEYKQELKEIGKLIY